jgi:hypothetical protein
MDDGKIEVWNVTSPHHKVRVDAGKYHAMKDVMLRLLPNAAPGMTPAELLAAMQPHLPQDIWPGGDKAGWWMKCVQLDLEARGVLARAPKAPVRLWRTGG